MCVGAGNCVANVSAEFDHCVDGTGSGQGYCDDGGNCIVDSPLQLVDLVTPEGTLLPSMHDVEILTATRVLVLRDQVHLQEQKASCFEAFEEQRGQGIV